MRSQADVIDAICRLVAEEPRVVAAWLEGSHATGEADPWSDIDLHLAVGDTDFDDVGSDPGLRAIASDVAPILGARRMMLGPAVAMLNATLAGPIRLDLYVERRSTCEESPRLAKPKVLIDEVGLVFRVDAAAGRPPVPAQLASLRNRYGYGFMWPARLRGRDDATTA